ncbi:MAG: CoB--CoM heterodisulfide reductase iron-sulfur subunit B family protein [Verrucomicrobiia bacterium]
MTTIGYYPGCSLRGTANEYDRSLRAVAGRLGVELKEIPDWVCCGATSAHAVDHEAALCLAVDTLVKARRAGLNEVLAPCAMCYQRLAVAAHELREQPGLAAKLAEALGEKADLGPEKVRPVSLLGWLGNGTADALKAQVTRPLAGLKVACYYGCLLVRPPKITGVEQVEAPRSMERIVQLLGAQTVRWSMAMECCGASFALSRKETVLRQGHTIYSAAKKTGADVICLACPMCHANLDMRQTEMGIGKQDQLPVVYLTQLAGLAMGMDAQSLGLNSHFVSVEPMIMRIASNATKKEG